MFPNEDLADLLERRRGELNLGQKLLADKSRTPRSSIKRYLEDPGAMRMITLGRVLAALDLTFGDLAALDAGADVGEIIRTARARDARKRPAAA